MSINTARILLTGAAGFIGYHLCLRLLEARYKVTGIDNLNAYYEVKLKQDRLRMLREHGLVFRKLDISDRASICQLFAEQQFAIVIHLAAHVGARHSIIHPHEYVHNNVDGFLNILEACKDNNIQHLLFASSSSVYGLNDAPFSLQQRTDQPITPYSVTKKTNELMAYTFSYLYGLSCTGMRFFTVYGPWGRPDMSYFTFTRSIIENKPIVVNNYGRNQRDFTYIDDVVEAIMRLIGRAGTESAGSGNNQAQGDKRSRLSLYNIGNGKPVELSKLISIIEDRVGIRAVRNDCQAVSGDPAVTVADVTELKQAIGYAPSTPLEEGMKRFIDWYKEYYRYPKAYDRA